MILYFTILKYKKISFPVVSESVLGCLIQVLTHILLKQPARNITEIQNTSLRKKKCRVNYKQQKCSNIFVVQSMRFSSFHTNLLSF